MRMQDILFGVLAVAVVALFAFGINAVFVALVGAFACGSLSVFAGMLPSAHESFWERAFISVFLAIVASSLVLILPGTFGAPHPGLRKAVLAVAGGLPVIAFVFEIVRTPRVMQGILRVMRR